MDNLKVQGKTTEDLKAMLLAIYDCKLPFAIRISRRRCKRILASYTHHNSTITIYDLQGVGDAVEVAIHEYAHHINRTEWWNGAAPMSKYEILLSAKSLRISIKIGLTSDFGSQPFLVIFELPRLKYNHGQKYTFLRTADIRTANKIAG